MKNKNSQYLLSAITLQKNKRKVNIFLNGQYAFSLSLLDLQKQGLKQGIYLDEADIARLKNLANFDLLYQKALGLLALRPRSAAEIEFSLKRYAQKKTITEDVDKIKRAVLLKLEKKNYLTIKSLPLGG